MRRSLIASSLVIAALSVTAPATAAPFTESGDAGQTPGTAQAVDAGTDAIMGSVSSDADLYRFGWSGGVFRASTIGGATFDTQLHLFNSDGTGIGENDDVGGNLQSALAFNLAADNYFLGISPFNLDATGIGGDIFGFTNTFNDLDGNFIQGPNVASRVLTGFGSGSGGLGGNYTITISETAALSAIPLPPTLLMLLGSLGLLVGIGRRKALAGGLSRS